MGARSVAVREGFVGAWDEDGRTFEGYCTGRTWNGWSVPSFTREVAERVVRTLNKGMDRADHIWYDRATDSYRVGDDRFDIFEGHDIETVDGCQHVYAIGAEGWCWSCANDHEVVKL